MPAQVAVVQQTLSVQKPLAQPDSAPLVGRTITAVNVGTGARFETSSTSNGGYTVRVPAGTYRLEFELRAGEKLAVAPEPTEVDPGDLDAGRNFVITLARR